MHRDQTIRRSNTRHTDMFSNRSCILTTATKHPTLSAWLPILFLYRSLSIPCRFTYHPCHQLNPHIFLCRIGDILYLLVHLSMLRTYCLYQQFFDGRTQRQIPSSFKTLRDPVTPRHPVTEHPRSPFSPNTTQLSILHTYSRPFRPLFFIFVIPFG